MNGLLEGMVVYLNCQFREDTHLEKGSMGIIKSDLGDGKNVYVYFNPDTAHLINKEYLTPFNLLKIG